VDCGLIFKKYKGLFAKVVGIKEFLDLIYNEEFRGPSPQCGGPVVHSGPRWTAGGMDTRHGSALPVRGARALGLAEAHRRDAIGRGGHGNSMGCSPGRGQQCGG
jgi:hypothetical protein